MKTNLQTALRSGSRSGPHNIDMEQALLACCILDEGQRYGCCSQIIEEKAKAEWFYRPSHQVIFDAILDLYNSHTEIDE